MDPAPYNKAFADLWDVGSQFWHSIIELCTIPARMPDARHSIDPTIAATLAKMLDPRQLSSAANPMDEAVLRLAEGPRLADIGEIELEFAMLARLSLELQRRHLEYNAVMAGAWGRASSTFAVRMQEQSKTEDAPLTPASALALWVQTANEVLLETERSEAFLAAQRNLLRAGVDLRLAQRKMVERAAEAAGLPTRTELDELHRTVTELQRDVRALRRAAPARSTSNESGAVNST
jgi:polyhydroxyalkanoate synthase subunit PhaE